MTGAALRSKCSKTANTSMSDSMCELEPEYGRRRDKVHQLWKADQESETEPAELFPYTSARSASKYPAE